MSSTVTPTEMSEALARGEQFTRIFVQPMVEAVRSEMATHVEEVKKALETVNGFEGRVSKLEKDQKKALVGWSVYASAAAGILAWSWSWIKGHLRLS